MTGGALALALAAAAVHAAWNLLLARAQPSDAAAAVALPVGMAALAPFALATWEIETAAVPWLAASAALEVAYFALLAGAYDRVELSAVYPVARGSAPLLVLLATVVALAAPVPAVTAVGVVLAAAGIALVHLGADRAVPSTGRPLVWGLAIGACIAAYTVADAQGVRHAAAVTYGFLVLLPATIVWPLLVARRRGVAALREAATAAAAVAGLGMVGAFLLLLAALEVAPEEAVPGVVAARETSVVMAVALAAVVLGERVTRLRVAGAAVVVAGVVLLGLAR